MKNFIAKLKFIFKFDIDFEYIVFDFENQQAMRFTDYKEAYKLSCSQIQFDPSVMVSIHVRKPN